MDRREFLKFFPFSLAGISTKPFSANLHDLPQVARPHLAPEFSYALPNIIDGYTAVIVGEHALDTVMALLRFYHFEDAHVCLERLNAAELRRILNENDFVVFLLAGCRSNHLADARLLYRQAILVDRPIVTIVDEISALTLRVAERKYGKQQLGTIVQLTDFHNNKQYPSDYSKLAWAFRGMVAGVYGGGRNKYHNLDPVDIRTLFGVPGHGHMGLGFGHGELRALNAVNAALAQIGNSGQDIRRIRGALVTMHEYALDAEHDVIVARVSKFLPPDCFLLLGTVGYFNGSDDLGVSVIVVWG